LRAIFQAFRRFAILPFESLIGMLAVLTGGLGLFHIGGVGTDVLSVLLPVWLRVTVQVIYLTAGLAMLTGLGVDRPDLEGFGLVTLAASTIIRTIALIKVVGLTPPVITAAAFNILLIWACVARMLSLSRREAIIRTAIQPEPAPYPGTVMADLPEDE
jgi:hypothetical protein